MPIIYRSKTRLIVIWSAAGTDARAIGSSSCWRSLIGALILGGMYAGAPGVELSSEGCASIVILKLSLPNGWDDGGPNKCSGSLPEP
jgi:hypothetical protein